MFVRLCLKFVDVCSSSSAIRQTQRKCTLMDNSCGVQFWVFLNFQMEILPLVVNNKKLIFSPTSWKPVSLEMFPCRMLEKKGWGYSVLRWSSDVIPTIGSEVFVIHKHGVVYGWELFNLGIFPISVESEGGGGVGGALAPGPGPEGGPGLRKLASKIVNTFHLDFFQVNTNAYLK